MAITAEKTKNLSCSNSSVYTYQLKVKFTETSTSTPNNTSTISITGSIGSENLAWDSYYNSYLKIYWHDNNTNTDKLVKTSDAFLSCGKNYGGTRSVSGSVTVEHKADGSLSGYAKVVFEAGSTSGGWSPSSNNVSTDTKALTTIPRASSFGTITGTTIGSNMTVSINRNASTFTHTLWYTYGDRTWIQVATDIATSHTFTLPMAICNAITDSTQGEIRLMLRTYSGTTIIGSDVVKAVSVSVPSSVVPTMNDPTATRVDNSVPSGWGVYVKGFSKVTIAASGASGVYGSTIKSYSISGPGLSSTASSATSAVLSESGTLTYKVTVTDSRGRTVTKSVDISVIDYSPPSVSLTAKRCLSDGTLSTSGTYLKIWVAFSFASVSSKNSITSKSCSCNGVSNTSFSNNTAFVMNANCSVSSTYTVTASVTDALEKSQTVTVEVGTDIRVFNVKKNKKAICFGGFAKDLDDNTVMVKWALKAIGDVYAGTNASRRLAYADELTWSNIANKPNLIQGKNANGYWGICSPDGGDGSYIRTPQGGLLPYQSGGHGNVGTSGWPFLNGYFKNIYVNGVSFNEKIQDTGWVVLWEASATSECKFAYRKKNGIVTVVVNSANHFSIPKNSWKDMSQKLPAECRPSFELVGVGTSKSTSGYYIQFNIKTDGTVSIYNTNPNSACSYWSFVATYAVD